MGRPLFSQSHATSTPAVRVEPEQPSQPYERWTYWNPFDPDSEEFFANAELETPVEIPQDGRGTTPVLVEVESSSSSEASTSGRGSPTQESMDEGGVSVDDLNARILRGVREIVVPPPIQSAFTYRAVADRARAERATVSPTNGSPSPVFSPPSPLSIPATSYVRTTHYDTRRTPRPSPPPVVVLSNPPEYTITEEDFDYFDSSPRLFATAAPVTIPARASTPPRPSTPETFQPSPPPSVTPRIYRWNTSRALVAEPTSPSPAPPARAVPPRRWAPRLVTDMSPGSPQPSLGARMSVAHITPSISSGRIIV